MLGLSPRTLVFAAIGLVLLAMWGVFAINTVVPWILRHVVFWQWLVAYVVCLLPALIVAAIILIRLRPRSD